MPDRAPAPAVEAYLDQVSEPHRSMLEAIRRIVREEAPDAEEVIAYSIPTFRWHGNLVHYAAFRNHCSFFPGNIIDREELKDDLAGYRLAKGTIRFTADNPLPDALIRKTVRLRIEEDRDKPASRKAKGTKSLSAPES